MDYDNTTLASSEIRNRFVSKMEVYFYDKNYTFNGSETYTYPHRHGN